MTNQPLDQCPVCSGSALNSMPLYHEHHLVQCGNCAFVFSNRRPSEQELIDAYQDTRKRSTYFSPITKKRFEQILDGFKPYRESGKLLEIGAGEGYFSQTALERNWDVHATEMNEACLDKLRSLDVKTVDLDLSKIEDENLFDVIVCIEVIEHVTDLQSYISNFYRLLRPGGIVYITTPNYNSIHRFRLKASYDIFDYPVHLSYFTHKTLTRLFSSNGFSKKNLKTTGYSITRRKTSQGKSYQEYVSETSDDEMLRHRIEKNAFLRFTKWWINIWLSLFGIGDSIKATYIKIESKS